ncbi:uncharacterized protein A4U43_C04F26750 [Asparagus officinalis]|uniref:Uncharacterized protein n=1 Tax=Asparagus officinalis TaxID=4686 RepID=A0A5P1F4G4_ASPOF|nr:uncharacterized protein A4U43_C04F26750 [Asparagus officinalis]
MFDRAEQVSASYFKILKDSEPQKANLKKVVLSLLTKEDELGEWHQEMEVRQNMIDGLKASDSQKLTEINMLNHEPREQNKRIRHLSEEVRLGGGRGIELWIKPSRTIMLPNTRKPSWRRRG